MATGSNTYNNLGVPLYGSSEIKQQVATDDTLTLTAASTAATDRALVVRNSAGTESFAVGNGEFYRKMLMGTVALASLASNASEATVALSGLTTAHVVQVFLRASSTGRIPNVYVAAANQLGFGPGGAATAAMTVNYAAWLTA